MQTSDASIFLESYENRRKVDFGLTHPLTGASNSEIAYNKVLTPSSCASQLKWKKPWCNRSGLCKTSVLQCEICCFANREKTLHKKNERERESKIITSMPMMILLVPDICICYNLTLLPLLILNIVLCMATCNNAEYEINGECCPMCDPGKRVHKHCDENTSTTCDSCLEMTYTDTPNGLTQCLSCAVCDKSNGLRVKQACTLKSNTVCEPLPGYHCIDLHSNCQKANKHSTCSPGQYVNQTGTEFSDAVCFDCPAGSYSNGTVCKLHTKCESLGKITVKAGTEMSDAECSDGTTSLMIGMSVIGVCVILIVITVIIMKRKRKQYSGARQVTPPQDLILHP